MLHLFLLLALATTFSYAADSQKPDLPFTLTFPDDDRTFNTTGQIATFNTTTQQIAWSKTLLNVIDDLGVQNQIPVYNVQESIFNCLSTILVQSRNPVALLDTSLPLNAIKDKIILKRHDSEFICVDDRDLLIQANYLDVHHKVKNSIAKLYTDGLRDPKVTVQSGNDIVFDNQPHELEPLPAGWLWHDMLQKIEPQTLKRDLQLGKVEILGGPIISNASSAGNVACMWQQVGDGHLNKDYLVTKLAIVDFDNPQKTAHFLVDSKSFYIDALCALSHDGRYVLVSPDITDRLDANVYYLHLYDLHQKRDQNRLWYTTITINGADIISQNIPAIICDDTKQLFHVLISGRNIQNTAEAISVFTIDPAQPHKELSSTKFDTILNKKAAEMIWSYVHGNLVGIAYNLEQGCLFKDGKLYNCSFDEKEKKWIYTIDDKAYDADFDVIQSSLVPGEKLASIREFGAIQSSFIPNIKEAIPHCIFMLANNKIIEKIQFDPYHLCITSIQGGCAQIHRLRPPKLVAMWHMLNKKIRSGDPKILIDSYVLNRYYTRPYKNWKAECDYLKPYTSKEVQEICNTDGMEPMTVDTKTKDASAAETPCVVS